MAKNDSVLLFSYGTLQQENVQLANFGRTLSGVADALVGYTIRTVKIDDPHVVAVSGKSEHLIVEASGNARDEVLGTVYELTQGELAAADAYEVSDYRRETATLRSGRQVWVYVLASVSATS